MDTTTKALLAAIALALWTLVAQHGLPVATAAEQDISSILLTIEQRVSQIARGTCLNARLCGP